MARIRTVRSLALALLMAVAIGHAADEVDVYERIEEHLERIYLDTAAELDDKLLRRPGDVGLEIERCNMMQSFAYVSDFYIEAAEMASTGCFEELPQKYPGNLEVELATLGQLPVEEALDAANKLHDSRLWLRNPAHHARLHMFLSEHYQYQEDPERRAGFHCIRALQFDRASHCRLVAAEYYESTGQQEYAIAVLGSPLDPHTEPYYIVNKIDRLSRLDAADAVAALFTRLDQDELGDYQFVELASSLANVGMQNEALALLDKTSEDYWQPQQLHRTRYRIALAFEDYEGALEHYNALRDEGLMTDPFLRTRFELASYDLNLPWRARDLLGILAILAVIASFAAIASVLPALVHYRGLVLKARGHIPAPAQVNWRLRDAWYALFCVMIGSFLAVYIFSYDWLRLTFIDNGWSDPESSMDLGQLLLTESGVVLVLLLPMVIGRQRIQQFWTGKWTLLRSVLVGTGIAIGLRLLFGIGAVIFNSIGDAGQTFSTDEAIQDLLRDHGLGVTLLVIAVLTPIIEELVFRGALLQGFARHISFRSANVLQSALFASMHDGWVFLPFYFVFAYVSGLVVRKSRSLLPAIIMHAVFNAAAISVLASAL